jgi:ribose-phosphate pyrophosphokinase
MIYVNNIPVNVHKFPAGEQSMLDFEAKISNDCRYVPIRWNYEDDSELFTLICVVNHIRDIYSDTIINLHLPYIPHARMDRTKSKSEIFTLKYFAKTINDLNFNKVFVNDPHSDVSVALLDRVINVPITNILGKVIGEINDKNLIIYFPDAGAFKRYKDEPALKDFHKCYGEKVRDWKTHRITGLNINMNGLNLSNPSEYSVLMIDDIISYGGTFYYSANKLKEEGFGKIYAYSTHTENEMLNEEKGTFIKSLNDGTVERLFTTNSIFNKEHNKIETIKIWMS